LEGYDKKYFPEIKRLKDKFSDGFKNEKVKSQEH